MTSIALQRRGDAGDPHEVPQDRIFGDRRWRMFAVTVVAWAMLLTMAPGTAQADVNLTPGPTVVADPDSPTGYTGHFVYYDPDATSVRFVADIMLRNWADTTDTKVYLPTEYEPGLMRGGGAYDVEMTNAGDGYWVTDVPLAAGVNQYWFYVDGNTNLWVADPANSPIFAPDGLTGTARRAFNAVYVPYDAAKQDFAPLAARQIELPGQTPRRAPGATCRSRSTARRAPWASTFRRATTPTERSRTRRSTCSTAAARTSPTG
nr:hypothetical protein GCM10025699_12720 [Microbacterium flavescens]